MHLYTLFNFCWSTECTNYCPTTLNSKIFSSLKNSSAESLQVNVIFRFECHVAVGSLQSQLHTELQRTPKNSVLLDTSLILIIQRHFCEYNFIIEKANSPLDERKFF